MRKHTANPFREAHGRAMRGYDWIAPVGTDPHQIPAQLEAALGVKLHDDGGHVVDGFVLTSTRPDGSVYVAVQLYDHDCGAHCHHHPGVEHRQAQALSKSEETKLVKTIGEHHEHVLKGDDDDDSLLEQLGFHELAGPRDLDGERKRAVADAILAEEASKAEQRAAEEQAMHDELARQEAEHLERMVAAATARFAEQAAALAESAASAPEDGS